MKILIIKTHSDADLILTGSALNALQRGFPDAQLTLLTAAEYATIATGLPAIDRVAQIPMKRLLKKNIMAKFKAVRTISRDVYDMAVVFQSGSTIINLLRSGKVDRIFALQKPGEIDGKLEGYVEFEPDKDNAVEKFVELAILAGGKRDDTKLDYQISPETKSATELTGYRADDKYCVVYCSSERNIFGRIPIPPPSSKILAQIIKSLDKKYPTKILLLGNGYEIKRVNQIAELSGAGKVLAGDLDRMETARVLQAADFVVSTDSYPLYLASIYSKRGIAIFTASNPNARPIDDNNFTIITPKTECAPCFANRTFPGCSLYAMEEWFKCAREVEDSVIEKAIDSI